MARKADTTDLAAVGELADLELTPEMLQPVDAPPPVEEDKNLGDTMAKPNTVRLQNLIEIEQFIFYEGKRWVLGPFQTSQFPAPIARAFQHERGQYVREYSRESGYVLQGEPIIWLANATGSPFYPDKVSREVVKKGRVEYEEIDNPLKRPRFQRWNIHIGQKVVEVDSSDGREKKFINFPPRVFELSPFERKPFAAKYAERTLEREGFCEEHERGKIVACRPPEPGEPNGSWPYEEIRLYAEMMDPATFKPMMYAEKGLKIKFPATIKNERHEEELKAELLSYLFFRLIDSRFPLVPYEAFEAERRKRGSTTA